jgi:cation-transporting ATPase 13A1
MDKKKNFFLLKKRKIYERLDIYPFIIILAVSIIFFFNINITNIISKGIPIGIVLIFQIFLYFSKYIFQNIMIKICYYSVNSIDIATHVNIEIFLNNNNNKKRTIISKLIRENNIIKTELEKNIYIYDKEKKDFYRSKFEILKTDKVGSFLQCKSLSNEQILERKAKFGENKMKIPIPSFISLYKEHILKPFFLFQLVCTIIKIFDNYNFYSLISLIMVCVFEIIIVTQRIINLAFLRHMRTPPYYIYVYRENSWQIIPSNELLPGDIVSVIDGASVVSIKGNEEKEGKNNLIIQIINKLKENKKKEDEIKNQKSINTVLNKYKEKEKLAVACDMLLLSGSVIVNESMLTGESSPQIKDSIIKMEHLNNLVLDMKDKHKNSIIFAGTKVVKVERNEEYEPLPKNIKLPPPDNGAICFVIKTGFDTNQGKLLRKVLYNQEKTKQKNKKEDFLIISILFIIALFVSCYVLYEGIKRERTLSDKLIIRCIIIITSIVPADLPIELSLIIYNSLFFFESKKIVCIESSRIPLAGKVNICCFDKTGTLTSDEYIMKGIIDIDSLEPDLAFDSNEDTFSVLLGCHSLLNIDGRPTGDPIDVTMFKEVRGKFNENELCCKRKTRIIPIKKYVFESHLKRMTVLAKVYSEIHKKNPYNRVLCKGAPEIIKDLLKEVPHNYDDCYQKWAKEGYRVLALAYNDNEIFDYSTRREELEKDLIFCGFAIFETPLKHNADKYIKELINAKYGIIIITGDHLLTTLKVAKDLKLGPEKYALLKIENKKMKWNDLKNNFIKETKSIEEVETLSKDYTLCITGDEYKNINLVINFEKIWEITQFIKLFCRVSQIQKVEIIKDITKGGKYSSMCGDGSNDVGALNLSTIGVAMLNIKENKIQKKEPLNLLSFDNDTILENLDAAAFAPFTSKGDSIKCVKNILVQGRCALVKYIQMYKIFIINSLLTIYSESFLTLKGIRFSEYQTVYLGFAISMFFLMFSKSKPLKKVNSNKPPITIFTWSSFFSIIGQVIIHISSLNLIIYITEKVDPFFIKQEKSIDERFNPNLINTITFLFQIFNQVIIFMVNYQGEPFMENIWQNSFIVKLIIGIAAFGFIIIFDLFPQLNEDLELVQLPEDIIYKVLLIVIMIFNFNFCYILENWRNLFNFYDEVEKQKHNKKKN